VVVLLPREPVGAGDAERHTGSNDAAARAIPMREWARLPA
jgi:hypothetical protein